MENDKYTVYHSSEVDPPDFERETYAPPIPQKPVKYAWWEIKLSEWFYKLACKIV